VTAVPSSTGCIFCDAADEGPEPSSESLVLVRGRLSYVILNLYPYNNGHLMVVPNRHIASLSAATHEELCELIALTQRSEVALTEAYGRVRPFGEAVHFPVQRRFAGGPLLASWSEFEPLLPAPIRVGI